MPVGVIRDVERPTHDELLTAQIAQAAIEQRGEGDLTQAARRAARPGLVEASGTPASDPDK